MSSLSVVAALSFIKGGVTFYSDSLLAVQNPSIGAVSLVVDGKNAIQATQTIGTTDETLDKGDIGTIGYVFINNLGTTLSSTPSAPIVTTVGTGGAQTWTYKVVALEGDRYTVASGAGSTAIGNATIDGTNFNIIKWLPVDGAESYDVYRTVSGGTPSTTGFIGNVLSSATFVNQADGITYAFVNDTGLTGDSTTAPTTTPWDFKVVVGSDGSSYPLILKGTDRQVFRWNAAAIHTKASFNPTEITYLIVEA